jgi:hypothetical protein
VVDVEDVTMPKRRPFVGDRLLTVGEVAATMFGIDDLALSDADLHDAIGELAKALRVNVDLAGNRWLFQYLTGALDERLGIRSVDQLNGVGRRMPYTMIAFTIAALGMTMVVLTGQPDISVGSILAICSTVAALAAKADIPIPLVFALAMGVGAALIAPAENDLDYYQVTAAGDYAMPWGSRRGRM